MIFGWIIIVVGIILLIFYFNPGHIFRPGRSKRYESPLDNLKKRFEAGEISKEEFDERKRTIEK